MHDREINDTLDDASMQAWTAIGYNQGKETVPWYERNTTANDDHRALRKMIIAEPRVGLSFVSLLQGAAEDKAKKANDITGKRRERKSVLPQSIWAKSQSDLQEHGIFLTQREKGGAATGRTRATLTYYGTSAIFYNHQVKTKIRMRIRYYLSYVRNSEGAIVDVKREGATSDKGYLELKVKSPRAFEENSVDKYRVLVSDRIIAELVNLVPTDTNFLKDIDRLCHDLQKENASGEDQEQMVATMFAIIASLSKRKAAFIRPSLVITYERAAYKYVEKDYPIPVKPVKKQSCLSKCTGKRKRFGLLSTMICWIRLRRRSSKCSLDKLESTEPASDTESQDQDQDPTRQSLKCFNDHEESLGDWILHSDDATTLDTAVREDIELHDIEYQFTIDQNVRAHYPLLPVAGVSDMPVAEHFDLANQTEIMRYPRDARVVEFKEPLAVATLPRKDRSATHYKLNKYLVDRMQADIMWGDYDENVGKYGNFRRRLMEEKSTDRIKNRMIEIDLYGSGLYLDV